MDFKLSAGVGGSKGAFSCVDEHDGCPTEAYILCAFDNIGNIGTQVDFLACMDEYSGDTPTARTPAQAASQAQSCSQRLGLAWDDINSCASGSQGDDLLGVANEHYEAIKGNIRGFPTPLINGKEPWSRDWDTLVKAICDAGLSCACNLPPSPSPSPEPSPSPVPSPVPLPLPVPAPVPTPAPSPEPSPSPFTPGDCFSADADQATCEGTSDEKTGEQCKWCGPDSFAACATQEWGCNSFATV